MPEEFRILAHYLGDKSDQSYEYHVVDPDNNILSRHKLYSWAEKWIVAKEPAR